MFMNVDVSLKCVYNYFSYSWKEMVVKIIVKINDKANALTVSLHQGNVETDTTVHIHIYKSSSFWVFSVRCIWMANIITAY